MDTTIDCATLVATFARISGRTFSTISRGPDADLVWGALGLTWGNGGLRAALRAADDLEEHFLAGGASMLRTRLGDAAWRDALWLPDVQPPTLREPWRTRFQRWGNRSADLQVGLAGTRHLCGILLRDVAPADVPATFCYEVAYGVPAPPRGALRDAIRARGYPPSVLTPEPFLAYFS